MKPVIFTDSKFYPKSPLRPKLFVHAVGVKTEKGSNQNVGSDIEFARCEDVIMKRIERKRLPCYQVILLVEFYVTKLKAKNSSLIHQHLF